MRRLTAFAICFISLTCNVAFAQQDYAAQAMSLVAKANYTDAKTKFEAAKAILDVKKVNKNSDEYIKVEKLIAYSEKCVSLVRKGEGYLSTLKESDIQKAYSTCKTEEDAEKVKDRLLADLGNASSAFKEVTRMFPSDKVSKSNLEKCSEIENQITSLRGDFAEILAWKETVKSLSLESYYNFLEAFPNGGYASAAKAAIRDINDDMLWASANEVKTYSAYKDYLSSFPQGRHLEEATTIVNEMREEIEWADAKSKDSSAAYKDFIKKYPKTKYLSDANKAISICTEREFWEKKLEENTVKGYNSYLSKYPKGVYASKAKNNIDRINEATAWNKTVAANTIESYQEYLSNSKKKAFKEDAEAKIAEIKHQQEVDKDEKLWAEIVDSDDVAKFQSYISSSAYKAHLNEAKGKYYLLYARSLDMNETYAADIDTAYSNAKIYTTLSREDQNRYNEARELNLFTEFNKAGTESNALKYLAAFPNGMYAAQVSDFMAKAKADEALAYAKTSGAKRYVDNKYQEALAYAKTSGAKRYVDNKYREAQRDLKKYQRKLASEPFHFLIGVQGSFYVDGGYETQYVGAVASLGGHSNRFNLEFGANYDMYEGYCFNVRPRLNIVKEKYTGTYEDSYRSGSKYSKFYLYVAPEYTYYMPDFSDYGVRVGMGLGLIDISAAYMIQEQEFTLGVALYFGYK